MAAHEYLHLPLIKHETSHQPDADWPCISAAEADLSTARSLTKLFYAISALQPNAPKHLNAPLIALFGLSDTIQVYPRDRGVESNKAPSIVYINM